MFFLGLTSGALVELRTRRCLSACERMGCWRMQKELKELKEPRCSTDMLRDAEVLDMGVEVKKRDSQQVSTLQLAQHSLVFWGKGKER